MEITTCTFILFLAVSLLIYWIVPKGYQWIVLLVDSLIFYFCNSNAYTIFYLLISVISVWLATMSFDRITDIKHKKRILIITIILNAGLLALLKYTNLAIDIINPLFAHFSGNTIKKVSWVASLGISFYTLQLIAYLCDAYWEITSVEHNPIKLLLYTAYFPNILSGPINRHNELGHQLYEEHRFNYETVTYGMKRIALGFLKKLVVSSRLATIVNILWNDTETYHGFWIWISMFIYVFQLYTDFSGCMDIMIGASECFGIRIAENFKAPFFSKTIQEFWQRWHITLGQWLKDYIMNPILKSEGMVKLGEKSKIKFGKKKGKKIPVYLSMLILWFCMGLWHGDNVKYIVGEGFYFWLVIVLSDCLNDTFRQMKTILRIKEGILWKVFQTVRTYVLFSVGMIFFRADSFIDAIIRMKKSLGWGIYKDNVMSILKLSTTLMDIKGILYAIFASILIIIYDMKLYNDKIDYLRIISKKNVVFRWALYIIITCIIGLSFSYSGELFAYAHF